MHRFSILSAAKLLQMPLVNNSLYQGRSNLINLIAPACPVVIFSKREYHPQKDLVLSRNTTRPGFVGAVERFLSKSNFFNPMKYRLGLVAYLLYEDVADNLDYNKFYKEFKLPDTFVSWFTITELHVWMLMVRCMPEGNDGVYVRNNIVRAMWDDCNVRGKQVKTEKEAVSSKHLRRQIMELSDQFNACVIAYDEGLTGDDKILASAIWRRIFHSECNDPEKVEKLVHYVRKQTYLLEKMTWKDIIVKRTINWKGLDLVNSN